MLLPAQAMWPRPGGAGRRADGGLESKTRLPRLSAESARYPAPALPPSVSAGRFLRRPWRTLRRRSTRAKAAEEGSPLQCGRGGRSGGEGRAKVKGGGKAGDGRLSTPNPNPGPARRDSRRPRRDQGRATSRDQGRPRTPAAGHRRRPPAPGPQNHPIGTGPRRLAGSSPARADNSSSACLRGGARLLSRKRRVRRVAAPRLLARPGPRVMHEYLCTHAAPLSTQAAEWHAHKH